MDAVLPLTVKDYERSLILRQSLAKFFTGLGTVLVVTPDDQWQEIREQVDSEPEDGLRFDVIPETTIAPELAAFPRTPGWYRQELLKLAIFEHVGSDFYLTLDADVFATRHVSPADLAPGGRGLCHIDDEDLHPVWYERVAHVLGEPLTQTGISHNVTPAVLARGGVAELAAWLDNRWREGRFAGSYHGWFQRWAELRLGRRRGLAPWRLYLTAGLPWTEYALYYSFLELRGRFDHYHRRHEIGISAEPSSYWTAENPFTDWRHEPLFKGDGPPYFAVVQSNTGVTPAEVRRKLGHHLS